MKVYRFEKNGIGPYNTELDKKLHKDYNNYIDSKINGNVKETNKVFELFFGLNNKLMFHRFYNGRPNLFDDIRNNHNLYINEYDNIHSGCLSIDDLKKWFKGSLTLLKQNGFKIYEYDIDKKHVYLSASGKQVGFNKTKVKSYKIVK